MAARPRDPFTKRWIVEGEHKSKMMRATPSEHLLIQHIRFLKEQFKTVPSSDASFEQDLFFYVKMGIMINNIDPCHGEDCKRQAKFLILSEKEAFCESCLEKKEFFRV